MQKCYNCGKEVDDNVLICPDCGALVKRYGKPVPVEPDSYHQQPQPDAYPGAYEAPHSPVRVSESGWTQRESRTSRALCASG